MSTINSLSASVSGAQGAALPHYNIYSVKDLPADAAATGILADGSVYVEPYKSLTASDLSFLKSATGQSFDAATVAAEQAAGTFAGNGLVAAIGWDRATGVLVGDITSSYLESIASSVNDPKTDGSYEGFSISSSDLNAALAAARKNHP